MRVVLALLALHAPVAMIVVMLTSAVGCSKPKPTERVTPSTTPCTAAKPPGGCVTEPPSDWYTPPPQ